jgi:hypothetical protein
MKIKLSHKFEDIVNVNNLIEAWQEFIKGKKDKPDVRKFSYNLIDNILLLHNGLINHNYRHGGYQCFIIKDPKQRIIHKASVRDRLLHHVVYRKLYPFFDKNFISDSFSCRVNKGTHKALNRFRLFAYKVSKNNTKTCWILKCDIRKFFASINQNILLGILKRYIPDNNITWLLKEIIFSFCSTKSGKGLPLGNLTSQLFANIYLNELDQFIKHKLRIKYYVRYCDDFVILSDNKYYLEKNISKINNFLKEKLKLQFHSDKIIIKKYHQGIDFLGYIIFPSYRLLRIKTKKRMFRKIEHKIKELKQGKISDESFSQTVQSYFGILKHCNSYKLKEELTNKLNYNLC